MRGFYGLEERGYNDISVSRACVRQLNRYRADRCRLGMDVKEELGLSLSGDK